MLRIDLDILIIAEFLYFECQMLSQYNPWFCIMSSPPLQCVVQSFAHVIMLLGTLHHVLFSRIILVTHLLILSYFNLYH